MKILILAPHPAFVDRETPIALRMLLESLAAEKHDLTAMLYPDEVVGNIPGCRILRVRKVPLADSIPQSISWKRIVSDVIMSRMAGRLLAREKFDLILAVDEAILMARRFYKRFGIPYVSVLHSSVSEQLSEQSRILAPVSKLLRQKEKQAIKDGVDVLVMSSHLETIARACDTTKYIQRLDGMSLQPPEMAESEIAGHNLKLRRKALTFMYAGSLENQLQNDLLLEAFSLANLEEEKIRLVIIGGSKSEISNCKRKAKKLGIAREVVFAGPKPAAELPYYLAQADILIAPHCSGHIPPILIYTYLDSGKPVVAARTEPLTQVLDDSIALLAEPNDSELANAMMRPAREPELCRSLTGKAKEYIAANFSRQAYTSRLNSFLTRITTR